MIDSSTGPGDLLGVVATVLDELPREIVAEVYLRIVTAFTGAPGAALGWCLHVLATAPAGELDRWGGRQVALEVLRLWPPGWQVGRLAAAGQQLGAIGVESGETVMAATYLMQRDPRWWDQPDRFDPGRLGERRDAARLPALPLPLGPAPMIAGLVP